ncbi:hypothetical protein [Serratia sp. UGAL515B_01]|uniref:hypothetical protein n=1 Tax=Serratia sp. UGAL515B_01 TaxID=2986763 RepID=UPI002953F964|nr:hypothetical protein [Serratia sp. UGAL515B_01]WON76962.1 hypothetical protein OK023_17605 [Serratia sp. UGAL515B_01]
MNKIMILPIVICLAFSGTAVALQKSAVDLISTPGDSPLSKNSNDDLSIDISKYQNELDEYQKILRQSEMLKLLIKRQGLMKQLGVTDPDEILSLDENGRSRGASPKKIAQSALLISTFKIGKSPIKAKIFVSGLGVMIVHQGEKISDKYRVESIRPGAIAVKRLTGTGETFYLPSLL